MKRLIILGLGAAAYLYGAHHFAAMAQTEAAHLGAMYTDTVADPEAALVRFGN